MFKLSEIKDLIKLLDETSVQELEIEKDGERLCIRKPGHPPAAAAPAVHAAAPYPAPQAAPHPAAAAAAAHAQQPEQAADNQDGMLKIVSPMVGTFYSAPSPDSPSYVKVGDKVSEQQVVCIIEAMKLMNEIEAEIKGQIAEILVENGQLVEYGQPLFLVKPE